MTKTENAGFLVENLFMMANIYTNFIGVLLKYPQFHRGGAIFHWDVDNFCKFCQDPCV